MNKQDFNTLARGIDEKLAAVKKRAIQTVVTARKQVRKARQQAINGLADSTDRAHTIALRDGFKSQVDSVLMTTSEALYREATIVTKPQGGDIANWLAQELSKRPVA